MDVLKLVTMQSERYSTGTFLLCSCTLLALLLYFVVYIQQGVFLNSAHARLDL